MVQNEVAQYHVYGMILGTFFPIFFSFYLGAWCDIFGRKLLFKLHAAARCIDLCIVITCAYFLESRKEFLLLASLPTAFVGKYIFTLHLSAILILNSFQVDIQFIIQPFLHLQLILPLLRIELCDMQLYILQELLQDHLAL